MSKDFYFIQSYEENLIVRFISMKYNLADNNIESNEKILTLINSNLHLTDSNNIAFQAHSRIIYSLINYYTANKHRINYLSLDNPIEEKTLSKIELESIPNLIEELHINFLNSKFSFAEENSFSDYKLTRTKSKHYLKEYGAVYTLKKITNEIVSKTISNSLENTSLKDLRCLDFGSGTGRFYFEAVDILREEYSLDLKDIVCNHLHAVDVDEVALQILKCKVISLFNSIDEDILYSISENILQRNVLIPKASLLSESKISFDFTMDFKKVLEDGGFSTIFSNPPYYLLKANNKSKASNRENDICNDYFESLKNKIKSEIHFFKTSGIYDYSVQGMLNYYQLSIEMIIRLTKKDGEIGIICPSSIFADLTASKLRKFLLSNNTLKFIRYYPESSNLFENVAQSTVIFYLKKGGVSDKIEIEYNYNKFKIDLKVINTVFDKNLEVPLIDEVGWSILSKLSKHEKIKNHSFIRNKRGELDLTLYKDCISKDVKTDYRLVRGNMICNDSILDRNNEFVSIDKFISKKSRDFIDNDLNKPRLICQQISNVDLKKRLKFTFSETKDILANSCNYINSSRSFDDLIKLHLLLNSELLDWRFKITSTNNHVNNYELDELPILNLQQLELDNFNGSKYENERLICKLYGLNELEINYILNEVKNPKQKKVIV